jgi:CelD/BcsL family acetyltransferase involved in cellulose biosynthesis
MRSQAPCDLYPGIFDLVDYFRGIGLNSVDQGSRWTVDDSMMLIRDYGTAIEDAPVAVELLPVDGLSNLQEIWKDLEARADGSFFLSWHWIGPWLRHLPPGVTPHVLAARRGDRIVGLAILCRRTIWRYGVLGTPSWLLHETGEPMFDGLTIEYNGILADRSCADQVIEASLLWMARTLPGCDALVLAGLDASTETLVRTVAAKLGHRLQVRRADAARLVDLELVRQRGGNYRAGLGRSTRAGVNRAIRLYEARGGIEYRVAADVDEALEFFDGLEGLHRAVWAARGKSDAFANPAFGPLHRDLIRHSMDAGVVRLCRLSAGRQDFGYLYNYVWRGRVLNYQSGFAYEDDNRIKPGLVSHVLAIEDALARGEESYDFMAGSAGHKIHLGNAQTPMNWITMGPDRLASRLEARLHRIEVSLKQWRRKMKAPVPNVTL